MTDKPCKDPEGHYWVQHLGTDYCYLCKSERPTPPLSCKLCGKVLGKGEVRGMGEDGALCEGCYPEACLRADIRQMKGTAPCERRLAACIRNDRGQLLPYTVQGTQSQVEEWAQENLAWDKVKELGGKIISVYIVPIEDLDRLEACGVIEKGTHEDGRGKW